MAIKKIENIETWADFPFFLHTYYFKMPQLVLYKMGGGDSLIITFAIVNYISKQIEPFHWEPNGELWRRGHSSTVIFALKEEIERLEELKRANIEGFIINIRLANVIVCC